MLASLSLLFIVATTRPPLLSAATLTVTDCGDTTPGGASGQLRRLINDAASGDTIVVPACTITLTGAAGDDANLAGDLDINKSLTIQGQGAASTIIDGGGIDRVFDINPLNTPNVSVALTGLTIRNADTTAPGGGALVSHGTLTLTNSVVSGNRARQGGGINNFGTLIVRSSVISGNTSTDGFSGGGLASVGSVSQESPVTLTNTTISGNTSSFGGGGISLFAATATLINVTIAGNSASMRAGGIQDTFSSRTVTLQNTIVANNTAPSGANCFTTSATITSLGHNLDSGTSCGFGASGDLINTEPMLGPLQLNGGPTPTMALFPGSPAIDAADNAACPATDQRGVLRPLDTLVAGMAVCDIGAVETETLNFITLSFVLDTATVDPGIPLQGTVTVMNTGGTRPLDVYVFFLPSTGVVCPNADPVVFLTVGGVRVTCLSSGVQTFAPLLSNVTLPGGILTPVSIPVFSLPWPPGAPTGGWTAGIAVTPTGAFFDQRVSPLGDLVFATAGFVAGP